MKIAIDLRSLSSGSVSGVENYTLNLLDNMLKQDRNNSYTLFFNSFYKTELPEFHYINAKIKITRWPNKILNLLLKFKLLTLEKLIGDFDVLYMPNLNQFNISKKAKLFLTVHDLSPVVTPEFYDIKRQLWHKFLNYKKAFKRADAIFAVSEYTKSDLTKLFSIPEEKIHVVYPGVDKKIFNPEIPLDTLRQIRNKYGLPGDYILFLNTIEPRKNLLGLIAAFESLELPCFLVIAGKRGWKYSEVFNAIKNSPKKNKIKYLAYVPQATASSG
jgi:glycosyltransferase involved in cell wall biosynthesis